MSENNGKDETRRDELVELADVPLTLAVGGTDFPIALLRPRDLAEALEFVVAERKRRYMANATINALLNPLHAEVLAKIECTTPTVYELPSDATGRLKLAHIALQRGGSKISYSELAQKLDPIQQDLFFRKLCVVSGIFPAPKKEADSDADPTEKTPGTISTAAS